jgi:hypothetical protein
LYGALSRSYHLRVNTTISAQLAGDAQSPFSVKLGPLFPRIVAAYVAIPIVVICGVLPLRAPIEPITKVGAFGLGFVLLFVLFGPRLGIVEVDVVGRMLTFRESLFARTLHPWRPRKVKKLPLPNPCKVRIGFWLDRNCFGTMGIKRCAATDGETATLVEQRFFSPATAATLASAIMKIDGVVVETVQLDAKFQEIPWNVELARRRGTVNSLAIVVGLLPYVGGAVVVLVTQHFVQLATVGVLITLFCTTGAYVIRKRTNGQQAAHRVIIDPFLYGFEFAFAAVLVHYMFDAR